MGHGATTVIRSFGACVCDHNTHGAERANDLVAHTALFSAVDHALVQSSAGCVARACFACESLEPAGARVEPSVVRDRPCVAGFHGLHPKGCGEENNNNKKKGILFLS